MGRAPPRRSQHLPSPCSALSNNSSWGRVGYWPLNVPATPPVSILWSAPWPPGMHRLPRPHSLLLHHSLGSLLASLAPLLLLAVIAAGEPKTGHSTHPPLCFFVGQADWAGNYGPERLLLLILNSLVSQCQASRGFSHPLVSQHPGSLCCPS